MAQHQFMSRQEAAAELSVKVSEVDRYISVGLLDRYRLHGVYVRVLAAQVRELAAVDPDIRRNA